MTYRFLADARAEFHDAVDWYEARRAGLGDEFSDEVTPRFKRSWPTRTPIHLPRARHARAKSAC